ncbi:MFS transporter [Streptomyces sp. NPDC056519]|uniref:MFS transporter n=1 Tax=Streptomyces sp. NPDC056519 TaxID=3345849 RepID=UPI00368C2AD3
MGHLRDLSPRQRAELIAMVTTTARLFSGLTSIVVALPAIQRDLGPDRCERHWIDMAALLPVSAFALVSGRLGDVAGSRKVFLLSMGCFGIGLVLRTIAPDGAFLVGARAEQGLGVALAVPLVVASPTASLPDHPTDGQWVFRPL